MEGNARLAYLAGLVDGDGYLKITKTQVRGRPYYAIQIGIQQLWPGEAVQLFSETFGGRMMGPMEWPGHRPMARCEVHTRTAEAALRNLLPYLLVKRDQALLLVDFCSFKAQPKRGSVTYAFPHRSGGRVIATRRCFSREQLEEMERLRAKLLAMHEGANGQRGAADQLCAPDHGPPWTRDEICAYLAGIMDSDGNFRVETRNAKRMLSPHYRIALRASQVVPSPAVELLARTFGGSLGVRKSHRPDCRDLRTWTIYDGGAAEAIEALLPHIVTKHREASLLLELRALKKRGKQGLTEWVHPNRWHRAVRMRKRCYTPKQVAEFERIRLEIQALHSGGAATIVPTNLPTSDTRESQNEVEADG